MNIGIMFSGDKAAGVIQYTLSIADSLIRYSKRFKYNLIAYSAENLKYISDFNSKNINSILISDKKHTLKHRINLVSELLLNKSVFSIQNSQEFLQLKKYKIKILIIPFASFYGFSNKIPYIVSIPDLMQKYYPLFPEYYSLRKRIKRNFACKNAAKHSLLTIADSLGGADDLNKFYGIPREKIRIITIIPAGYIYKYKNMSLEISESILKKFNLPERFLFYPAQFWYHKNHIRLVKSLKILKNFYNVKIYLVLVGSPKESYKKIMNFIKKSDISNQIICLDYVSDKEIVALYKKAVALVYPSLFGPTNIPPLEAMLLGTPVICSNLFSMPDQIDDAGLLFNPFEVKDMTDKIYKIWVDKDLRNDLIRKGYKKAKNITLERYAKQWEAVIDEALERIK